MAKHNGIVPVRLYSKDATSLLGSLKEPPLSGVPKGRTLDARVPQDPILGATGSSRKMT